MIVDRVVLAATAQLSSRTANARPISLQPAGSEVRLIWLFPVIQLPEGAPRDRPLDSCQSSCELT
jgi:hypothetical protein